MSAQFELRPESLLTHPSTREQLAVLADDFNTFTNAMSSLADSPAADTIRSEISAGRFDSRDYMEKGIIIGGTQVLSGDWAPRGNIEGSEYIIFGDSDEENHVLRVRLSGSSYMTLGNITRHNSHEFALRGIIGDAELVPRSIEGQSVAGVNESGIEVIDGTALIEYRDDLFAYNRSVREAASVPRIRKLSLKARKWAAATAISEPEYPLTETIEHATFNQILQLAGKGLRAGAQVVTERRAQLESTPKP